MNCFFSQLINKRKYSKKFQVRSSKKTNKKRKQSCKYRLQKFEKYQLFSTLAVVINHHFPDFYQQLSQLPDYRKRPQYEVKELIVSGLLLFLFRQQSRNNADSKAKNLDYQDNMVRFFNSRVADMDTVDRYLRFLDPKKLEQVKQEMFRKLIKSKILHKHKFLNSFFMLSVDGTGLQSFDYEPYPGCPYKKHKNGKITWTAYVLDAKIITLNGFSLSIATQWIENPIDEEFDKQDCELKAFKRLSIEIKKEFPRLPLIILLDGLYPNKPVFDICRNNNWSFIITLKDNSLKSVQEQIADKLLFKEYKTETFINANSTHWYNDDYKIFDSIDYQKHKLFVVETLSEKKHKKSGEKELTKFVHITNIEANTENVHKLSQAGRARWKIENEGFNDQKTYYNMEHKFSRTNFNASKNYYQLLQMAHIINQLTYKLKKIRNYIKEYGFTIQSVMNKIFSNLCEVELFDIELINSLLKKKQQLRY